MIAGQQPGILHLQILLILHLQMFICTTFSRAACHIERYTYIWNCMLCVGSSFEAYQAAVEAVQGFESCSILQNTEHSEITIFFFFMPKQHIFFIFFMCLFRSFFLHLSYSTIAFCLSPSLCLSLLINQSTSLRKWHLSRKKKTTCGAVKFWCRISTVHCASVQYIMSVLSSCGLPQRSAATAQCAHVLLRMCTG